MAVIVARRTAIKGKHQRLVLILLGLAAMIGAALLAMSALKDQAAYFYTPAEARAARGRAGAGDPSRRHGGAGQPQARRGRSHHPLRDERRQGKRAGGLQPA